MVMPILAKTLIFLDIESAEQQNFIRISPHTSVRLHTITSSFCNKKLDQTHTENSGSLP